MQRVVAEAELSQVRWQEFDEVIAVRAGDADGVQVFAERAARLAGRNPRKRRLLVQVQAPDDVTTHERIKAALGILPRDLFPLKTGD